MTSHSLLSETQRMYAILAVNGLLVITVISVVAIIATHRTRRRVAELEADARNSMLAKGFSPEEIVTVLQASRFGGPEKPRSDGYLAGGVASCDVVAQDPDGEWGRALLLEASPDGSRFLIYFVGRETSENAWRDRDQIQFPASLAFEESSRYPHDTISFAIPATVEWQEEWYPAYVVVRGDRCYVHYVEHEWSQNQWVDESRVRYQTQTGGLKSEAVLAPEKQLLDL